MKNSPIPVKFIINFVGPVTLDPEYWYSTKDGHLENIEPKDIENAIKEMDFYGKKISDHIIRLKQEGVLTDYQGPKKGTIYQILAFHPDCPLPPVNHKYNLLMICSESDDMVVSQAGRHILSLISKGISSFRSTDLTEALKISSFQVGGVIRWLKAAEIIEDKCFLRIIHFPSLLFRKSYVALTHFFTVSNNGIHVNSFFKSSYPNLI